VALRSEEPGASIDLLDELRTAAEAVRLSLGPLRPASVTRIVRERVADASDEVCAAAHAVTAGNPFYLHELLRVLRAGDAVPDADALLRVSVPSLGDRVIRRAGQVAEDAPALAQSMAVLGDGARLATAASLASVPEQEAIRIAHRLRRIEVLAVEDPIAFVHPLVRRSVYDAMPEPERQSAHRQAARLLEQADAPADAVAAQLQTLKPSGDSAVATMLLAAAERALDHATPDEAVDWLERALAEGSPEPPRAHLLARLGAAMTVQRNPAAIDRLREAYELARDPTMRANLAATLAEVLSHAGQWNDAIAVIESIEGELDGVEPEIQTELAVLRAAVTLFDPARIGEFDARRDTWVKLARGEYWASHAIAALLAVEAVRRGRPREAIAFADRALENGRLVSERGAGAWTTPQVIGALIEAEDVDRAMTAMDVVDAAARASGAVLGQFTATAFRGWANARRGELAAAEADLLAVLAFAEQTGLLMGITTVAHCLSDVLLERENLSQVEELLEQVQLGPDFLNTVSGAMLLEVRGRLRLLRRDRAEGIEDLRAAGRTISALRFGPAFSTWRSSLALALPAADRVEALALAEEELELARSTGLTRPVGIALRTLGILSDPPAGIELLQQSVDILEGSPARLDHARSLVELGSALRRANRRVDARSLLVRGLELAHACGAHRLTQRARQELHAAGGRRSRIATSGRESLTASELRVVRLAAAGATNTQIAQELYVSLKTVETHLSHAYVKLGLAGLGSRGRLAHVLEERSA
jgi:DNA-binding CsgD family transcriptional regulator